MEGVAKAEGLGFVGGVGAIAEEVELAGSGGGGGEGGFVLGFAGDNLREFPVGSGAEDGEALEALEVIEVSLLALVGLGVWREPDDGGGSELAGEIELEFGEGGPGGAQQVHADGGGLKFRQQGFGGEVIAEAEAGEDAEALAFKVSAEALPAGLGIGRGGFGDVDGGALVADVAEDVADAFGEAVDLVAEVEIAGVVFDGILGGFAGVEGEADFLVEDGAMEVVFVGAFDGLDDFLAGAGVGCRGLGEVLAFEGAEGGLDVAGSDDEEEDGGVFEAGPDFAGEVVFAAKVLLVAPEVGLFAEQFVDAVFEGLGEVGDPAGAVIGPGVADEEIVREAGDEGHGGMTRFDYMRIVGRFEAALRAGRTGWLL